MDAPKLCINCRWVGNTLLTGEAFSRIERALDINTWLCNKVQTVLSPVDGVTRINQGSCSIYCTTKRRDSHDPCGPEGKQWELKDPSHNEYIIT